MSSPTVFRRAVEKPWSSFEHLWSVDGITDRFWSKIDKSGPVQSHCAERGPCWVWAKPTKGRYVRVRVAGKTFAAHRVSWELEIGPIPDGLEVCHHCDNTKCVRPEHLFLGTHEDNMRDCVEKGRSPQAVHPDLYRTDPGPCINCGKIWKPLRRGRCGTCSSFLSKTGTERPYKIDGRAEKPRQAICKRGHARTGGRGCRTCQRAYDAARYARDKERILARDRARYREKKLVQHREAP